MAKKYCFGKEITKTLKTLDVEKMIAVVESDTEEKERKIFVDEFGGMAVRDSDGSIIHITEWDLRQHGLIDEEVESIGLESTYEKIVREMGK